MQDHDAKRHPGPWRVMQLDSEFAGLLVAVGFLVMGLVSMPIATVFVIGTVALGVVVALLLRFVPRKISRVMVGTIIILAAFVLWWAEHKPRRPHTVSSNALYVVPNNLPLRLRQTGYWLECWFDQHENVDRCKLADTSGNGVFEDVYVTCGSQATIPQSELVYKRETGRKWIQSPDERVNLPVLYVRYDQILVPRSLYTEAKQEGFCYGN
jgi:hypothetical protein